jgi:DHA2 family methylenomycin A resistance protein-like MFS transporter
VRFDIAGAFALSLAVGAAVFALGQGGTWGVTHPVVLVAVVLAPIAGVAFVRIERRVEHPLLPLGLLRIRNVRFTLLTDFFQGAVYFGAFVLAPLALRNVYGLSATVTSTVMLLRTGVFAGASPVGGHLGARIGTLPTALLGTSVLAGAMGVFVLGTSTSSVVVFCVGLVIQGAGFGLARPPVTAALANAVPEEHLGLASALGRMSMQIGNSFGITLLTALYDDSGGASGFVPAFVAGMVLGGAAIVTASFLQGGRFEQRAPPSAETEAETVPVD